MAVGSNWPGPKNETPETWCRWAVGRLSELPGLSVVAVSRWFRSAAEPPSEQPDFVNGVVRLAGEADPWALLRALHGLEAEAGRVRTTVNAARTLDLDLLAMDGLVVRDAALTLPHPRMAERAFVLAPLCDVAPEWRHPVLGRTAAALLAALPNAGAATPLP